MPCSLCWALITSLPILWQTPAPLTSSVGENLTRTLHRSPGARSPAKGSASKTQGLAFASCCSFRRMLAGKCLSTWAQKPTPWQDLQGQTHHSCTAPVLRTGRPYPQRRRKGWRWQTSAAPARELVQVNQSHSVPSVNCSPSAQAVTGEEKAREAKETQLRSYMLRCHCFTFLTGSVMVMNHLQGTWN